MMQLTLKFCYLCSELVSMQFKTSQVKYDSVLPLVFVSLERQTQLLQGF